MTHLEWPNFSVSEPNGIVVKPLYLGFIDDRRRPKNIYTSVISKTDLRDLKAISLAPSIYQQRIQKRFDIRVTVVGEKVFAAQIEAKGLPCQIPDWRYASLDKLHHKTHRLPMEVRRLCIELVEDMGLKFGAIDLAIDSQGNYIFFEINPNGQWAWLEKILGFKISKALVDQLHSGGQ